MSIKVQQSRFALLKVEDDESDGEAQPQKKKEGQKKRNKKKKQQTENRELQHLAFGLPVKQKGHSNKVAVHDQTNGADTTQNQWEQWQNVDEKFAAERFEQDLAQALLQSKLESEKKTSQPTSTSKGSHMGDGDNKDKQKKKKDKPQAMSLDQFNKTLDSGKSSSTSELDVVQSVSPVTKLPPGESEDKFFEKNEDDVHRIIRKEKMQEEYKKHYATESVITAKYQEQNRKMEKELEFLRATLKKQEEELKQVKKRNKQLCVILAQGEMKDKAEVLMQVDQLSEVKDELTEQVTELTAELEKERSKAHALKTELDKYKSGKHK